jgi:hypothetical protein
MIRETDPAPIRRSREALSKWTYRRRHRSAPNATPVFLVGLQRSGTTALTRSLGASAAVEIRNEANRHAFDRFRIRDLDTIRRLVMESDHQVVLFKPLCDSHRVLDLLNLGAPSSAKAIWAFRSPAGRIRSSIGKFGHHNLDVLSAIARGAGPETWQSGGLSPESLSLIRSFDYATMTPATAAALFWYVRNQLVYTLGLDRRPDVLLIHYDLLTERPAEVMRPLCRFIGIGYDGRLHRRIHARPTRLSEMPADVDPSVARICLELDTQLRMTAERMRSAVMR